MRQSHLEDAAKLVAAGYGALRRDVPILPRRHEKIELLLPLMRDLVEQAPGVVAIHGRRLVGFLIAWLLPEFRGQPATYSPEWAHGAEAQNSRAIYQAMYARLSALWVAKSYRSHLLTMLIHDPAAIEAWHWLGFGLLVADAVRDLAAVRGASTNVEVHRAGPEQVGTVMEFDRALDLHLAAAPVFRPADDHRREYHEQWLADPAKPLWVAYLHGQAVAMMGAGPSNPDACHMVCDPGTASILTAYTSERWRERGIGSALLNQLLAWARSSGYVRCAVDFETQNLLGARFWLRNFQPVCYSMLRCINRGAE